MTVRPTEPEGEASVFYRGWEAGYEDMASRWSAEGYRAYKGGCDLDAPTVSAPSWDALLDAIDEHEDD